MCTDVELRLVSNYLHFRDTSQDADFHMFHVLSICRRVLHPVPPDADIRWYTHVLSRSSLRPVSQYRRIRCI